MALYELTATGSLAAVPSTSFAAEGILERADLQRALREQIEVIGADLLVVAEEFGDFEDVRRRIDLLCVSREGQLVVVELKRTDDGGHMELQALRYAAMVSTMTFRQLADTYEAHLRRTGAADFRDAHEKLAEFLDEMGGEDTVLDRRVRIVLVSAGFDTQITTTVLWLNDLYGLDINCVRLQPYRVEGRLVLDVQQVIPLPEAEELMVKLRRRENEVRAASSSGGADWTQYVVVTPTGETDPLRKRRAILALAQALHQAGVRGDELAQALPRSRFLGVEGVLDGDELWGAFVDEYPKAEGNLRRWFADQPFHDADRSWLLSKMWGTNTTAALDALAALRPSTGFGYRAAT